MCYTCGRNTEPAHMRVTKTSGMQNKWVDFVIVSCAWGIVGSCSQTTVDQGLPQSQITSQSEKSLHTLPVSVGQCYAKHHTSTATPGSFKPCCFICSSEIEKKKNNTHYFKELNILQNQVFLSRFNWNYLPVYYYSSFLMAFLLKDRSYPAVISASELWIFSPHSKATNEVFKLRLL